MHRSAYVLLLATAFFWGGNSVAGKMAVGHVSPMLLTTLRWGIAAALLLLMGWRHLMADWPAIRKSIPLLTMLGFTGFTLFNVALYTALNHTSAINTSIEQAGIPMVIFAANFLLFRIRVTALQILGFLLSLCGIALTASHGAPASLLRLDVNFGDALMLLAVLCYSAYTVALRFKPDIHWLSMIIVLTVCALATSLPFAIWEQTAGHAIAPDTEGWLIIVFMVLFPSILAQVFYIRGVEMIGANRAGIFVNLVPIFGTLLSVVVIGEAFHIHHAVAMVLVLGGIWLAEYSGRKNALREESSPSPVR